MALGQVNQNFPFKLAAAPLRHEKEVWSAAFSPDGKFVVTASGDGSARVWPWFKPVGDSREKLVAGVEHITLHKIATNGRASVDIFGNCTLWQPTD